MSVETWKRTNKLFGPHPLVRTVIGTGSTTSQQFVRGLEVTTSERGDAWSIYNRYLHDRKIQKANPDHFLLKGTFDWGNAFLSKKSEYSDVSKYISWKSATRAHEGRVFAHNQAVSESNGVWPTLDYVDAVYLNGAGTIAIERTMPSNPIVDLPVAIGELMKDLPAMPGSAIIRNPGAQSAAGEYLNWQFGIEPTVSDIENFRDATRNSAFIIKQMEKDSGKLVRRQYSFEPIITTTTTELAPAQPSSLPQSYEPWYGLYRKTLEERVERHYTFSAAYTYHFDVGDDLRSRITRSAQIAQQLYGIRITPDVLYALVPFSWLIDWYASYGAILSNASLSAINSQVTCWAYIMCETKSSRKYTLYTHANPYIGIDLMQEFTTVTKQRVKASPYGFGLNPSSFTDEQWAILFALGLSRSWKQM